MKIKHVEIFKLTFEFGDTHEPPNEPELEQIRNQADAWMQQKFKNIFMDGYAFEQIYYTRRGAVVEYTR